MSMRVISKERKERDVSELFAELASEMALLVKQEAALATTELGDKVRVAGNQIVFICAALLVGTASLLTLVAALVIGLSAFIPAWISAAVVGAVLGIIGVALYQKSVLTLSNVTPVPERTARSIQETKSWVRQQTR